LSASTLLRAAPKTLQRGLIATAGLSAPSIGAAATISGEGVSPAARAAASGSPPGKAAATCNADDGPLSRILLSAAFNYPFNEWIEVFDQGGWRSRRRVAAPQLNQLMK
jgi:hypothetical protein